MNKSLTNHGLNTRTPKKIVKTPELSGSHIAAHKTKKYKIQKIQNTKYKIAQIQKYKNTK